MDCGCVINRIIIIIIKSWAISEEFFNWNIFASMWPKQPLGNFLVYAITLAPHVATVLAELICNYVSSYAYIKV